MSEPLAGALAPPMINGEAVFETPWQGRVFGMAHALADAGVFGWDEFRAILIEEIADRDRSADGDYRYYEYFQRALERVLAQRDLVPERLLVARSAALAERPDGHDHGHDHNHAQGHAHPDHDHGG